MVDVELCYLSATEALRRFRAHELSPVELLEAQWARAQQVNPVINAFCSTRIEAARAAARASERVWMHNPEAARALEGIPTVLKNEHMLIGERTDSGSQILGDTPDTQNAPITDRLLEGGAVIHARSNVPDFCIAPFTRSPRYGVTRNPWNPAYTCGGSTGGGGAALAAGLTTLASASDIGGSIRMPAAYCGVVGLKASYGRVPESNMFFAMNTYNHNGVMARSVADCALMFNAVNGPHAADPASLKPRLELPLQPAPVRGLRVALSVDLGYFDVDEETARNTRAAAQHLRDQGCVVEEVQLAWGPNVRDAFTNGLVFTLGHQMLRMIEGRRHEVDSYVGVMADMSRHISTDDFLASFDIMGEMHAALQQVFERFDVMICPTLADNRWPAEGTESAHDDLLHRAMTYPFNMLSRHPVLAVPSGFASHGVPTGLQIVGRTYEEPLVMQVGAALEQSIGWTSWRPPVAGGALR